MNAVCNFIEFIRILTDEEYSHDISYYPSKRYFKNGGCYELVKTVKYFLPDSQIYINNGYDHCALHYKGILYDIDGIIEDNRNYHLITEEDKNYLDDELLYGRIEIKFDSMKPSDALIQNILKCRIEPLIEACKQMNDEPSYYRNKQKQIKK